MLSSENFGLLKVKARKKCACVWGGGGGGEVLPFYYPLRVKLFLRLSDLKHCFLLETPSRILFC